jgi:hypothetical protein
MPDALLELRPGFDGRRCIPGRRRHPQQRLEPGRLLRIALKALLYALASEQPLSALIQYVIKTAGHLESSLSPRFSSLGL